MSKEVKEIELINKLKREISKTISRFLKKHYKEKDILEATIKRCEEVGVFKKK